MLIYSIENLVNGKYYIGQTIGAASLRFNQHLSDCERHPNKRLSKAIRKYGRESFEVRVLSTHETLEEMNLAERLWIALTGANQKHCGYNTSAGGNGWGKRSAEQRAAISNRQRGKVINEAQRAALVVGRKIRATMKRAPMPLDARLRIGEAHRGTKRPPEFGAKISAAKKGLPVHPNTLANLRMGPGSASKEVLCAAQKKRRAAERQEKTI